MISHLLLKFGSGGGEEQLSLPAAPITIFVGPNNSGKSRVLSEIAEFCREGTANARNVIIEKIIFSDRSYADPAAAVALVEFRGQSSKLHDAHIRVGNTLENRQILLKSLLEAIDRPEANKATFCQYFLRYLTLNLDGRTRLDHVANTSGGDLKGPPSNTLQMLFKDDKKRKIVRDILYDALGRYFVIDPTNLGQLCIRYSDREPARLSEERGIDAKAVAFHSTAQHINELSDGVRALTGILIELLAGDPAILLIDEPEAFLHPALAYKLGIQIAKGALQENKHVFVSTHSPAFVMGAIQSGIDISIVRLTYQRGTATARSISSAALRDLMRDPLLRSANALSGIFYDYVVVTEADPDRAFYQEINHRLLEHMPGFGIQNCLFINAQNKQTIPAIVGPLRSLGIPTAGIVDIDIVKDGGQTFAKYLNSFYIPSLEHQSLSVLWGSINTALVSTGKDMKRDGGVNILTPSDRAAAESFFDQLQRYGLFVVRYGELEYWLKFLGATGKGPQWLAQMFEKMGANPISHNYLKPSSGDVWKFISDVRNWLADATRQGIPGPARPDHRARPLPPTAPPDPSGRRRTRRAGSRA